ncbi:hypothetical protein GsuE55_00310 [Geobacillus subterraneus]|uniref:Uncharacterized protein n=2 Tax=Geobacillus TaxID=129337 RepID=A0A679FGJ8_9BACL|nr:hypothetical protein [Geobacillus icigianus]BBW95198.1 hypothetical protein GsuE55_00310 [Geobacillus subterraneus]
MQARRRLGRLFFLAISALFGPEAARLPAFLAPTDQEEMRTFLLVVVHLPLLGLRTRSLYISTFKSR